VQGATFLGGEPFLNTPVLIKLAQRIRKEYGDTKDIWSWSGYTWEELMREGETEDKKELLSYVDILVDGRFIEADKDSLLQFRGSSNQRIIDVRKSLESGKIVIWDRLNDGQRAYTEISLKTRSHNENE
jgi:anaerobic ribonucleoside-triphosphate reductase activating protein